ncbi:MAG: hypothetical protein IPK27_21490 [Rhodanobacteraceae bacterium]|nr:hypothetical protein [Rhodanobacteraceae bacterium]
MREYIRVHTEPEVAGDADKLTELQQHVAELFEIYTSATAARAERVGASLELADLRAIADDAEAVAEAGDAAPRALLSRLRRRLANFPPFAEPMIAVPDVSGHFARLDRLRAALAHRTPPDAADLRALATACRACPRPPNHTKASRAPADRLQQALAAMAAAMPLKQERGENVRQNFVVGISGILGLDRTTYRRR